MDTVHVAITRIAKPGCERDFERALVKFFSQTADFPGSLDGAPALLPADNTALRGSLETWFSAQGIRPKAVAEFEDTALLKTFASGGLGFFAVPTVAVDDVARAHAVQVIGEAADCRESFFALTAVLIASDKIVYESMPGVFGPALEVGIVVAVDVSHVERLIRPRAVGSCAVEPA